MEAKHDVMLKPVRNSIHKNLFAAAAVMLRALKCVQNTELTSWNINVVIAARWRYFSVLVRHTSAIHATMISSVLQTYRKISCRNAQLVRKQNNCLARNVHCILFIHQLVKSSLWAVVFVETLRRFSIESKG